MSNAVSVRRRVTKPLIVNCRGLGAQFQASLIEPFTWFNADLSIASRLDAFLILKSSYHLIISCHIFPCAYSDPDFVILDSDLRDRINRGPGVWKFNSSLLSDVFFRSEIVQLMEQSLLFRRVL